MKKPQPKNLAASVHQRLLNKSKETHRTFNELLQLYGVERFLYRLSCSAYAEQFVLKGALLFSVWKSHTFRATKDIDLLGKISNAAGTLTSAFKRICIHSCEADGVTFDPATVACAPIAEDAEYEGMRVRFMGYLGAARIPMQIDIGFGDPVHPRPVRETYPTLLDFPPPKLIAYTRESAVAEKFHAMVKRGRLNSRMKDFFDLYVLSRQFTFEGSVLAKAISKTFQSRETKVPEDPVAFTEAFMADPVKQAQWRGFIRKARTQEIPKDFEVVVAQVSSILLPVAGALSNDKSFRDFWQPPGPWTNTQPRA